MSIDIARAWKDAQYSETLSSEERAQLPESPIGAIELTDSALATVDGAHHRFNPCCCGGVSINVDPCFGHAGGSWYGGGYDGGYIGGGYIGGGYIGGACGYVGGGSWYGGNSGCCC